MEQINKSPFTNQVLVVSGVFGTIFGCGISLGENNFTEHRILEQNYTQNADTITYSVGVFNEIAFISSIIIIPFTMQRKGRRIAHFATTLPLVCGFVANFISSALMWLMIVNILYSFAVGGAIASSSVIISEFSSPKYRDVFLMLETVMLSLGILISHVCQIYINLNVALCVGVIVSTLAAVDTYFWPESPYWLISGGHIMKSTEIFYSLRGEDEDSRKEMNNLLTTFRARIQIAAMRPIMKISLKERIMKYLKALMKTDFLKPLSVMILLFTFIGFAGECLFTRKSYINAFSLTDNYIDVIVLDFIILVCSVTACILVLLERRKSLFMLTGSISSVFLFIISLFMYMKSSSIFPSDFAWLTPIFGAFFAMFISLGTTALPFSLLGEIFPMSYKGIGSAITCAYLWAMGNAIYLLAPLGLTYLGMHGVIFTSSLFMVIILIILNRIMPETSGKSLIEIEEQMSSKKNVNTHGVTRVNEVEDKHFDNLKLLIEN